MIKRTITVFEIPTDGEPLTVEAFSDQGAIVIGQKGLIVRSALTREQAQELHSAIGLALHGRDDR